MYERVWKTEWPITLPVVLFLLLLLFLFKHFFSLLISSFSYIYIMRRLRYTQLVFVERCFYYYCYFSFHGNTKLPCNVHRSEQFRKSTAHRIGNSMHATILQGVLVILYLFFYINKSIRHVINYRVKIRKMTGVTFLLFLFINTSYYYIAAFILGNRFISSDIISCLYIE